MVATGPVLAVPIVHVWQALETLPKPARTASRPTKRVPQGSLPRGMSSMQSSAKNAMMRSRSWPLNASSRSLSLCVSVMALILHEAAEQRDLSLRCCARPGNAGIIGAVESHSPSEALVGQQYADGLAAFRRGDNAECRRLSEAAIATAAAGSERGQALGHIGLSRADFRDGDYASGIAHALAAEDHASAGGAGDLRLTALHMRAELTRAQGDYAAAVPLYQQLLAADQADGDEGSLAMEHYNLGSVLLQAGDLETARVHLQRSLQLCPAKPAQLRYTLLGYAGLLARSGDPNTAGQVLGAVQAHFEAIGEVLDTGEALELSTHIAAGLSRDAEAFDSGRRAGHGMPLEHAQALVE
jgi:tetratricopeptide (TPR) repeat protein